MTPDTDRCPRSDLPPTQCAHCRGDDGTPGLWYDTTHPPKPHTQRVHPDHATHQHDTPWQEPTPPRPLPDNPATEDTLRADLHTIRETWPLTDNPPNPQGDNTGPRPTPDSRPPTPLHITSARRETLDILTKAATDITRGRNLQHPPTITRGDAVELAWFIDKHAMWAADHLTERDYAIRETPDRRVTFTSIAGAISHAATQLDAIARGDRTRRFKVWTCVATTTHVDPDGTEHEGPCPGTLYARMSTQDLYPAEMRCNRNPHHRWTAREWLHLGRQLWADANRTA